MESEFFSFQFLFPILFFILILSTLYKKKKPQNYKPTNLPPGPKKLPIIGNMHQMSGALPHRKLAELAKKHGPIMYLQLGEIKAIVISSPETAKAVMKTHDILFASRPYLPASDVVTYGCKDIAFSPYGDCWRQLRKICILELLSSKRVQSFQSIREEEIKKMVSYISSNEGSIFNLSSTLISSSYSLTAKATFGKKSEHQEAYIESTKETIRLSGGFSVADVFPSSKLVCKISGVEAKLEKSHKTLDFVIEEIINEHKAARKVKSSNAGGEAADLVDVLLDLHDDGNLQVPLTMDNVKGVILDMFTAGSETSSTTLEWVMSELLRNPRTMEKAQAEVREVVRRKGYLEEANIEEMKYLKAVVKETLRLRPPLPLLLPRECREQCQVNGFDIPVKTRVIVNSWALGRDPDYWVEPEKFLPERFIDNIMDFKGNNFEYLPFGAGRRMCPGILFGITNVHFSLAHLLYHFNWKLPDGIEGGSLDMAEDFGATVRRKNDLH